MTPTHRIPALEVDLGPGIRAFFTTRHGGVSVAPWESLDLGLAVGDVPEHVRTNRARVDAHAGAPVTYATQVHGRDVAAVVTAPLGATAPAGDADALVTTVARAPLGVYVADCVPVLLADPVARVVATAHAGRPGVELGVVGAALDAMVRRGARVRDVRAAVGPSVCGRCYEVPPELRDRVAAVEPRAASETSWGTPALDLPRAVEDQLERAGVVRRTVLHRCTRTDDDFFSHRRASAAGLVAGRFAGVVGLVEDTRE